MLSASSLVAGICADRYGARPVVMALAGLAVVWAGVWLMFTRRLWRL
jgi:hypothetical protein